MYTEYSFNGKVYQFHTESSLAMGKDAFIAAHKGVPNIVKVWESMNGPEKAPETKVEKAPKTKVESPDKEK